MRGGFGMRDTPETDEATLKAEDIVGGGMFDAVHSQVSKRLERERNSLRNELASGVHSCHDQCTRPVCIIRRERDQLRNLLSTVLKSGLTDQVRAEARKLLKTQPIGI